MTDEPKSAQQEKQTRHPPQRPRKSVVVRIFRALARQKNRNRRRREKNATPHQINERTLARWTRNVGWFTAALVLVGVISAVIFKRQLDAMQGQLDAMEAGQRPWVKADVEIADLKTEEGGAIGTFRFKVKNIGRSPALNVNAWPVLVNYSVLDGSVDDMLKKHCDEMSGLLATMLMIAWGNILFPGDSDEIEEFASIDVPKKKAAPVPKPPPKPDAPPFNPAIAPNINQLFPSYPSTITPPSDVMGLLNPPTQIIQHHLLLLACVTYKSAENRTYHQTAESLYVVEKAVPDTPDSWREIDIAEKQTIGADRLKLMRSQFNWRKYAN